MLGERAPLHTDDDQPTTFVELFFDLVFVFALTQIVSLLASDSSWAGVGRALIVFWLVWWAWTQFTWALNSADTTHPAIELATLAAAVTAVFMAITIPNAFGDSGLLFAVMYVVVRIIGLGVYVAISAPDAAKRQSVVTFAGLSVFGLVAVIAGGMVEGDARTFAWLAALVLDLVAASLAGTNDGWDLRPEHFGERHGLFVIIALGETLIVTASGLTGADRSTAVYVVGFVTVVATAGLWWTYFARAKPALDARLHRLSGGALSAASRDVFSFLHFPLVFGVALLALAAKKAVAAPSEPLDPRYLVALLAGVALFELMMVAGLWRTGRRPSPVRPVVILVVVVAAVLLRDEPATVAFAVVCAGLLAISLTEEIGHARAVDQETSHEGAE